MTTDTQRPTMLDDLFKLHFIQSATISFDGQQVAYVVSAYDEVDDADYSHIWLYTEETGTSRQLTFGKHNNSGPIWSPDGKQLSFISTRAGKSQLHRFPLDGGDAQPLTNFTQGVSGKLAWSPDGRQIAFTAGPLPEDVPDLNKPYRVTRHIYRSDGLGYLDSAVQDIYIVDLNSGEPRRLTHSDERNSILGWSPEGDRLLFTTTMLPDKHDPDYMRLRILTIESREITKLLDDWGKFTNAAWHPNNHQIVFSGTPRDKMPGTKVDIYLVDSSGKEPPVNRSTNLLQGVGGELLDEMPTGISEAGQKFFVIENGDAAYVHVQVGGAVQIYHLSLVGDEAYHPVISGDRAVYLLGVNRSEDRLLFSIGDFNQPYELAMADGNGRNEQQITHLNDHTLNNIKKARVKQLSYRSKDNVEVEGWLIMPAIGDGPFPTLLNVHGGPQAAFGHVYYFDTQMLVGAGYAVLMVNHRGSTGYGSAFGTGANGDWGNLDYADLMAGVDYAIDIGIADENRLGIFGSSGGGYLSCWAIGQTNRFKAASPENPVTNWQSFYGVSDIGVRFSVAQLGDHPHKIPEVYIRCSPITYAHNCITPTLMIQGEADWRCPAEQSEQFYTVLKANGCKVEMLRLPGSSHDGSITGTPATRRAQNEALLEWMDRFVKS